MVYSVFLRAISWGILTSPSEHILQRRNTENLLFSGKSKTISVPNPWDPLAEALSESVSGVNMQSAVNYRGQLFLASERTLRAWHSAITHCHQGPVDTDMGTRDSKLVAGSFHSKLPKRGRTE
jgi:hypothetical protein